MTPSESDRIDSADWHCATVGALNRRFAEGGSPPSTVVGNGRKRHCSLAFGKAFIANPDLPLRLRTHARMNALAPETIYAPDATGYTDYPALTVATA